MCSLGSKLLGLSKQTTAAHKPSKKKKKVSANIAVCKKKISYGHYTPKIHILSSDGLAPATPETLQDLMLKHPPAPPPSIPAHDNFVPALSVEDDVVLSAIKSFPKGTSYGRDGLRAHHLLDAFSGASSAISDELLQSIIGVVNLWLGGHCPSSLGEFIASAPFTPLLKQGGGGETNWSWDHLEAAMFQTGRRFLLKHLFTYLSDFQFGMGTSCGGEGILHAANRLLELKRNCATQTMMLFDFVNAFNLVDRSAMLKEVSLHCPNISKWVEFYYSNPTRLLLQ